MTNAEAILPIKEMTTSVIRYSERRGQRPIVSIIGRALKIGLAVALILLLPSVVLGQNNCSGAACQYCGTVADVGLLGCALSANGCGAILAWYDICKSAANALPPAPPPPPNPNTACSVPQRQGTTRRRYGELLPRQRTSRPRPQAPVSNSLILFRSW